MGIQKRPVLTLSILAAATILADQPITAAGAVATAAGDAIGFAQHDAVSGELVAVVALGTATGTSSAAIAKGARVQVASDGKVVTATTGISIGVALDAASAANEKIEIFLEKRPATS
ncbi:MAG: DUF2190 family protein [Cellvibrio sp.]